MQKYSVKLSVVFKTAYSCSLSQSGNLVFLPLTTGLLDVEEFCEKVPRDSIFAEKSAFLQHSK